MADADDDDRCLQLEARIAVLEDGIRDAMSELAAYGYAAPPKVMESLRFALDGKAPASTA